jgi:hypothetical protein
MVSVLAAVKQPRQPGRGASPAEAAAYLNAFEAYNAEIYSRSASVLSPKQLEALAEMQKEQINGARLSALMPRFGQNFGR